MKSHGGVINTANIDNRIDTVDNKHFLWSLLDEEHVFTGLNGENMQSVINIFETAINTVKNSYVLSGDKLESDSTAAASLAAMNKEVIRRTVIEITRFKNGIHNLNSGLPSQDSHVNQGPIKMIYKSEDIHEARIQDMTSKLKLHEDDMNSFLVLKKPAEINFADDRVNDDRPIGDEMEQLIQAALASRARELEIMMPPQPPQPPQTPQPSNNRRDDNVNSKKTVSFSDNEYDESVENNVNVNVNGRNADGADKEIATIFNKLKRIEPDRQISAQNQDQQDQYQNRGQPLYEKKRVGDGSDIRLDNLLRALYDMNDSLQGVIRAAKAMQNDEFLQTQ